MGSTIVLLWVLRCYYLPVYLQIPFKTHPMQALQTRNTQALHIRHATPRHEFNFLASHLSRPSLNSQKLYYIAIRNGIHCGSLAALDLSFADLGLSREVRPYLWWRTNLTESIFYGRSEKRSYFPSTSKDAPTYPSSLSVVSDLSVFPR